MWTGDAPGWCHLVCPRILSPRSEPLARQAGVEIKEVAQLLRGRDPSHPGRGPRGTPTLPHRPAQPLPRPDRHDGAAARPPPSSMQGRSFLALHPSWGRAWSAGSSRSKRGWCCTGAPGSGTQTCGPPPAPAIFRRAPRAQHSRMQPPPEVPFAHTPGASPHERPPPRGSRFCHCRVDAHRSRLPP